MSTYRLSLYGSSRQEFPSDFPRRLERLREALGLTWKALAKETRLNLRAIHRWRTGTKPDAPHLLVLLDFAAERGVLECLLDSSRGSDLRQGILFDEETWIGLTSAEGTEGERHGQSGAEGSVQRAA